MTPTTPGVSERGIAGVLAAHEARVGPVSGAWRCTCGTASTNGSIEGGDLTSRDCRAAEYRDHLAAELLAHVQERLTTLDFSRRRLGMAFPDPWREGWNRALEVAQDDLRLALDGHA